MVAVVIEITTWLKGILEKTVPLVQRSRDAEGRRVGMDQGPGGVNGTGGCPGAGGPASRTEEEELWEARREVWGGGCVPQDLRYVFLMNGVGPEGLGEL